MSEPTVAARRPPTKRDDQREASRRRLLNAALEILAEEGYRTEQLAAEGQDCS
ncbi:hypothetical protein [Streptomyces sp. NPDC059862]|uniref:hypothetical protein n=1 Tax=unclassified Streptomyces TaxID=2593676 RepID=UPI00363BBF07